MNIWKKIVLLRYVYLLPIKMHTSFRNSNRICCHLSHVISFFIPVLFVCKQKESQQTTITSETNNIFISVHAKLMIVEFELQQPFKNRFYNPKIDEPSDIWSLFLAHTFIILLSCWIIFRIISDCVCFGSAWRISWEICWIEKIFMLFFSRIWRLMRVINIRTLQPISF